jgi:choline dehydrogenase-like flavoprotein
MTNHHDIIIIGTGAGGGTMLGALAPSGKRILVLERGDFLPRERQNWDTKAVYVDRRYQTHETWHHHGQPFRPEMHYWVGGNTKMFGAAMFRLRETDFGRIEHAGGTSPAWPISYHDLEPYYTRAEQMYSVHGRRGVDPTEPPTNAPYPFPPIPHEPRVQQLEYDLRKLGYSPFPLPLGVRLGQESSVPSAPTILSQFDGYPDPTESKADAHTTAVKPALEYNNVTLLTNRKVERLETDASGHEVHKVVALHDGQLETYSADLVVLAAGAANSAALMLRSANNRHPRGLANRSDLVGRNYMCHQNSTFLAISKEPNDSIFQKTLVMSDFYGPSADWAYPMGLIQMLGKVDEVLMAFETPQPFEGMTYADMSAHSLDFWLQSEDLPDPENRVTINAQGEIELRYVKNNLEAHERLIGKLRALLSHIGCFERMIPIDAYLGTKFGFNLSHQNGTMRFGTDPASSVLDLHCKAHELNNLYVVDASFFPSCGAVNPSLTIIANSLRVADHLLERMNVGSPEPAMARKGAWS